MTEQSVRISIGVVYPSMYRLAAVFYGYCVCDRRGPQSPKHVESTIFCFLSDPA